MERRKKTDCWRCSERVDGMSINTRICCVISGQYVSTRSNSFAITIFYSSYGVEGGYRHGFIPSFEHRKQAVDIRGTAHSYKFVITHSSELEW